MGSCPIRDVSAMRRERRGDGSRALGSRSSRVCGRMADLPGRRGRGVPAPHPAPGVFSPIQYGAHVRDIQRVYGDRILLMLHESGPVFPQFNPDESAWNAFNELEVDALADQIHEQAERLAGILAALELDDWSRTMVRDGGSDGVFTFTVAGLASYAVHESRHHLRDANGTLPSFT